MEDNTIEGFLINLSGEISIREDIVQDYLKLGSKLYLFTRNVGTFISILGFVLYLLGYSHSVLLFSLVFVLSCVWVADYFDYSTRILIEMRLISTLRDVKSNTTHAHKFQNIGDPADFVSSKMIELGEERKGATFVLESDFKKRGQELSKKIN